MNKRLIIHLKIHSFITMYTGIHTPSSFGHTNVIFISFHSILIIDLEFVLDISLLHYHYPCHLANSWIYV